MALEWVGYLVTGAVGITGAVTTGLTARGGRRHAEIMAKDRMLYESQMANDARRQGRIADAYVDVLDIVLKLAHHASQLQPLIETDPPTSPPPVPPLDEQSRADALMHAFGSRETTGLYDTWKDSFWAIVNADRQIRLIINLGKQGAPDGAQLTAVTERLGTDLRPAEETAREELIEAIAVELGSRPVKIAEGPPPTSPPT